MRTAIIGLSIYALALFAFMPDADANWSFGPHINRPGPHLKHRTRCVSVGWLRYCRDHHNSSARRAPGFPRVRAAGFKHRTRCRRLKVAYRLQHPGRPPRALRRVHGCRRYILDARFHRNEHNNPVLTIINVATGR